MLRSCLGGRISPLHSWQKNNRKLMACMQMSRPDDLLSPLFRSSNIWIVTGAHLLQKEETGLNSLIPFRTHYKRAPPCQSKPHLSCSFLITDNFAPTILPANCPAKEVAHALSRSSLAGRALLLLILRPSQKFKNSQSRLVSLACVVFFTATFCIFMILSIRI